MVLGNLLDLIIFLTLFRLYTGASAICFVLFNTSNIVLTTISYSTSGMLDSYITYFLCFIVCAIVLGKSNEFISNLSYLIFVFIFVKKNQ